MKHFGSKFVSDFLHVILLLCMSSYSASAVLPANESDRLALLDFKSRITQDPLQIMSSWIDSIHFCNWVGVTCNPSKERVTILNLQGSTLAGSLPPAIGNLTFLTRLILRNNSFHGELPQELGRLLRLQHLNLTDNFFSGSIPTNLSHCTDLRIIHIEYNKLIGQVPDQLSSSSKLMYFTLEGNNLTGKIPPWIGNFSSLEFLYLGENNFHGAIPGELGRLSKLKEVQLNTNYLSGMIPPSICNISSIYYMVVTENQLQGQIPPDFGLALPNLLVFAGGVNHFTGPVPVSLSNSSRLIILDFAENNLTGTIPENFGSLTSLRRLNFDNNRLGNGGNGDLNFISFLSNCTRLKVLGLGENRFGGELPSSISNLSTNLTILTLGGNLLQGSIPIGIQNLISLYRLAFADNLLSGYIPDSIGKLQKLQGLTLGFNKLSGPIPSSFGNLTALTRLSMEENRFEGSIPPSLGGLLSLLELNLSGNNLKGTIPTQVFRLASLSKYLDISRNSLTGSIPFEVGSLKNVAELDLSENKLSGTIPSSIGSCTALERLRLEGNEFEGTIPESLKALRGIQEIDLSHNNLSGPIPEFLSKLSILRYLNLSYNDFEGEVSREGVFANKSAVFIAGNDRLCGGIAEFHLPVCSTKKQRKVVAREVVAIVSTLAMVLFIILLCFLAAYFMVQSKRKKLPAELPSIEAYQRISYSELAQSTDGFSVENLIGSGSFGMVYKGILPGEGTIVAIKVLNLQQQGALKSFIDECNALTSIRHRNLLKIVTACSSVDHQGNDFKALIFEFMSNGNLDQWLHPKDDEQHQNRKLSLIQRLNIAIDVASALDYLHTFCEPPIVHCDLKPSNVLLDDDKVAHVADFGLAKFLFQSSDNPSNNQTLSTGLKGSIGYIPPEHSTGSQVSVVGDIYSFGILLLEMFTGKRPTDDMFKDDLDIHKFTAMAIPERVMDTVDKSMVLFEVEDEDEAEDHHGTETGRRVIVSNEPQVDPTTIMEEWLVSVLSVGLSCSATSSLERMAMDVALNKLTKTRDSFLKFKNRNRNRRNRRRMR